MLEGTNLTSFKKTLQPHKFCEISQTSISKHITYPNWSSKKSPPQKNKRTTTLRVEFFYIFPLFLDSKKLSPHPSLLIHRASGLATTFLAAFKSCAALEDGQLTMVFGAGFVWFIPKFPTKKNMQRKHTHKWNDLEMNRPIFGKLSY